MKIKIVDNVREALILHQSGKTFAEKEQRYEGWGPKPQFEYEGKMRDHQGDWMEVDTQYLFDLAFNGIHKSGGLMHVDHTLVTAVDISPEFKTLDEWIAAVQKRYDKDWPGRKVEPSMRARYQNMIV